MPTHILVTFYSSFGHTHRMARAAVEGANRVPDVEVRLKRIAEFDVARKAMQGMDAYQKAQEAMQDLPEVTLDDLVWAHGVMWGIPTRFGNMPAQVKQFIDTTGPLWSKGRLENKAAAIFTSSNTIHGGQESTVLTSLVPLLHLGYIFVGNSYGTSPQQMTADGIGGSPYGASTVAGPDGSRQPEERELAMASNLGERLAKVAQRLKDMQAD